VVDVAGPGRGSVGSTAVPSGFVEPVRVPFPDGVVVALDGWVVGVEGLVVVGTMGAAAASVPSVAALGGAPPDA